MFDMFSRPPPTSGCGLNNTNWHECSREVVLISETYLQRDTKTPPSSVPKQQTDRNTCSLQVCQSQFSLLMKQKKRHDCELVLMGQVSCERAHIHARDPGNGWQLVFTLVTFHSTAANSSAALCVNSPVWSGRQRTGALSAPLWSTAGSLPR